MKPIELTEEELNAIHSFVDEVRDIAMVECVYLLPYVNTSKEVRICVITIRNNTPKYNLESSRIYSVRKIDDERNTLREIMDYYERELWNGRLSFIEEDSSNYSLSNVTDKKLLSERKIVSGIIVFDRFGHQTENRKNAFNLLDVFPNSLSIANKEQLLNQGSRKTM